METHLGILISEGRILSVGKECSNDVQPLVKLEARS